MGFNYLKATEPLRGDSFLFTIKFPDIPGTHLIDLGRMKGRVDLGATEWFCRSCNTVDDLSTKICVPNKTKSVNVKDFNMVTRIYEAKTLVKHISCDCKCKFNSATCNSNQKWNNDKCQCECKFTETAKKL